MIKSREEIVDKKLEIDLNSPQGNAFVLIGIAGHIGKQLGMSKFRIKCIQDEMKLSTYDMLIETFDKWFGDYVILYK